MFFSETSTLFSFHTFLGKAKGEVKLFFQEPQQLLSIFTDLEDENLSLIQECREAEGNLEKVRTSIQEVRTIAATAAREKKNTGEKKATPRLSPLFSTL